jgi:hypothetical protein
MSLKRVSRTIALAFLAVAVLASPAFARVKSARGNIQSVDWNVMQIAIKGIDGKVNTFRVRQDAGVKFTDGAEAFPNSSLKDLIPPMYVWFDFEDYEGQEPGLIQKFDVRDMPADMRKYGASGTAGTAGTDGSAVLAGNERQLRVRLQSLNTKSGEFKADVAGRNTSFRATSGSLLSPFREGDLVVITIQRTNGQDRVTNIQKSTSPQ